ncbi:eIF-2-alpha kinase activator GCN1 [Condylostylus longicornis]|uniref:eIF-2-alpha kinase activator GCN1 n=1 Tax=Condylostylus longicornis TaxID=2530218 RepID=UPI00244DC4DE|nr:eIF-2-alpha kinase activator GCN1 [Condylostylus longicornis]
MENQVIASALKDLPNRVLNSNPEERSTIFKNVSGVLENPDMNTTIVNGICKVIGTTLLKYKDPDSQRYVTNLITELMRVHPTWTVNHFTKVLNTLINKELKNTPKGLKPSVIALGWTVILLKNAKSDIEKCDLYKIIEVQSILYEIILMGNMTIAVDKAEQLLFDCWTNQDILHSQMNLLLEKEASSNIALFIMLTIKCEKLKFDSISLLNNNRNKVLDYFLKGFISSKKKTPQKFMKVCKSFLNNLNESEFKDSILPAIQRSMLRNPELILENISTIISEIQFDISDYCSSLAKALVPYLYSKEESARKDSLEALSSITVKCSKIETILDILKCCFEALNRSSDKITVAEYRINIFKAIGNLSINAAPVLEIVKIIPEVTELFEKALETEIQEKVAILALEMFSLWALLFEGELPDQIMKIFKKGMESKNSTQSIRIAYLQWLIACLENGRLKKDTDVTPLLITYIEKATQPNAQIANLYEGVCCSCIILRIKIDLNESSHNLFWNLMLDTDKNIFLSEKFITTAPAEALCNITLMAEILLTHHYEKIKGSLEPLFKAIMHGIVSSLKKVRTYCLKSLSNIKKNTNNFKVDFSKEILKLLTSYIQSIKVHSENENIEENGLQSEVFAEAIKALCTFEEISITDAYTIGLQAILCAHHPSVVKTNINFWETIVQNFEVEPKHFIAVNYKYIQTILIDEFKPEDMYCNAIETICRVCPQLTLHKIVDKVVTDFSDFNLIKVTQDEYLTFLMPEGELYDKSVIPNSTDIYSHVGLKRENKVYSYKEQLEELQLRKELDEKRKKEGKIKPVKLTPKQIEAIKTQTEKESQIRQRLKLLNEKLHNSIALLRSACKGSKFISAYFSKILTTVLKLMSSPLAAEPCKNLFYELRKFCFSNDLEDLGTDISIAIIRLCNPFCNLDDEWLKMDLNDYVSSVLVKLNSYFQSLDDENSLTDCHFTAPCFCYTFELLKRALISPMITKSDELLIAGIKFIEVHAQVKGETLTGEITDLKHPNFMPRFEMFNLLLELISKYRGRIQTQAVSALLEVANISSGHEYCSKASVKEFELFLRALQQSSQAVRDVSLRALIIMSDNLKTIELNDEFKLELIRRFWIAKHDISEDNKILADELWEKTGFNVPLDIYKEFIFDVLHPELCIQKAAASAYVSLLKEDPSLTKLILNQLLENYHEKLEFLPAILDQFDREIEPAKDQWEARRGIALSISQIAQFLTLEDVDCTMNFMVSYGLSDREDIVHKQMLAAALCIVDFHGKETINKLLPVFEKLLDQAPNSSDYDNVRQAVVILMGSLARHLEKDDERIQPIVKRLLAALSTPSEQVQESVSNCLPHLMYSIKDEAPAIIKKLLQQLVKSDKFAERRGAAYGLAGMVKGLGILSLKQYDIMPKLTTYIQEKKHYKYREGALFAFEMLCITLGRLFEPYIVHVIPYLLQCFGDSSQYVREAADETAKVVMGKLSAHGVKLILPSLLKALDEDSWRTKTASVELLGAMAYCAPKQLSSCLPSIVPKLIEVLGDSHTKVQEAGADALKVIGSVIKNPEIQAIVPVLLKALEDPSKNTSVCLCNLLQTKFVHFIDAPSLALIMPVVQRAFLDRSTETRKMASQIIGNMYSLTDQKDLAPYLPSIIPGLKASLLDPVPEVRAVSARALGAMVRGMGESSFDDLLPWLMQTLTSETSSVDRSGAAQGLSEVVAGLGVEKMHKLMPEIISTAERSDIAPHVKDGYIMMFIYMPGAFQDEFTPYIGQIINPILKALADENEYVRETALKAGQRIVNMYAETAVTLLLPELEKGLFDENWRIRYSSVQLLGDLLYRISGVSGKMTTETASEDDNFGTEQSHSAIIHFLGPERRNRVLAGLYMGRSDVSLLVRQSSLHIWKLVVTNTPRTLREILPTLFNLLLGCLASTSYDKRQVAARTLGDLVRKLGERVLPEIIPILERGLNSDQSDQRQGVCIGLSEIMTSTSKEMVLTFVDSLVPTVRKALSDPLPEVRSAAAKTFDSLHATVGSKALDDILPFMLENLSNPDPMIASNTLDGLRQVMSIKSKVVLPYLVPQLTAPPVNIKALSILVSVAGDAVTKYLPKILPALLDALANAQGTSEESTQLEYCQTVILSVNDEAGVRIIVDTLINFTKYEKFETKKSAATLLSVFCIYTQSDYSQYVSQLLRTLLRLLADSDRDILQKAWEALNAVIKNLEPAEQITHVMDVRQAVRFAASELNGAELPGFCLPKGITPLLPVFREAILNGLPEEKESAAQGLGEIISLTSPQSLQPSVVHITGPLIRILGDRFNSDVKAAVLETLAILLRKVGIMLKQFLPQLQTTFLKALHDNSRSVRLKAGQALAELINIHLRPDPLFIEIHNGIKNYDDPAVRDTMLQALRGVITFGGDKMSETLRKQIHATLISMLNHNEETTRNAIGGCLGALCKYLPPDDVDETLKNHILSESDDFALKHGRTIALYVALKESPDAIYISAFQHKITQVIASCITSDRVPISSNGVRSFAYLTRHCLSKNEQIPQSILTTFVRAMNHESNEIKQLVAKTCSFLAKSTESIPLDILKVIIPMLVNGTKEKNVYVKCNSEIALVAILRLRSGDELFQNCLQIMDAGARESLNEVVVKVLRKVMTQPTGKEEEYDTTLIA